MEHEINSVTARKNIRVDYLRNFWNR